VVTAEFSFRRSAERAVAQRRQKGLPSRTRVFPRAAAPAVESRQRTVVYAARLLNSVFGDLSKRRCHFAHRRVILTVRVCLTQDWSGGGKATI
jgi:hypothetical protein